MILFCLAKAKQKRTHIDLRKAVPMLLLLTFNFTCWGGFALATVLCWNLYWY